MMQERQLVTPKRVGGQDALEMIAYAFIAAFQKASFWGPTSVFDLESTFIAQITRVRPLFELLSISNPD